MNMKFGTTKGSITANDSAISATTGHATSKAARMYASDYVLGELIATGDGKTVSFPYTTARKPLIPGSVKLTYTISAVTRTVTDDGAGAFVGTGITTGTISSYTAGTISVLTFATAPDNATPVVLSSYRFNVEKDTDGIGELNLEIVSSNVDAQVFPLKLTYSVFSAINLQKIHGMVMADEGMKFATQEIRFAIDQAVHETALEAALSSDGATSPGTFTATPVAGDPWVWKVFEFKRYLSKANMAIFTKTLRVQGNVIVAGTNVASLIEQIDTFKSALSVGSKPPAGPYVFGQIGQYLVICNPFYDPNTYVMLHRGDNYLFAGMAYCPYVPMYSTEPLTTANLQTQRGFMSQAAIKVINAGMFCVGAITGY